MYFLSNIRFLGFTVLGFWLPLIFWAGYLLFFARGVWKDLLLMGLSSLMLTFYVSHNLPGFGPTFGLANYAYVSIIPAYFLLRRAKASYGHIGVVTYFAMLFIDVVCSPVTFSIHTGWVPWLLVTQPYHMSMWVYQGIGGGGLLDGLVTAPLSAITIVKMVHVMQNRSESEDDRIQVSPAIQRKGMFRNFRAWTGTKI